MKTKPPPKLQPSEPVGRDWEAEMTYDQIGEALGISKAAAQLAGRSGLLKVLIELEARGINREQVFG